MYLVKVDRNEVNNKYQKTRLLKLLDEFVTGGYDCARVEGAADHYKSLKSAQNTIKNAIKCFKFRGVRVSIQNNEIYLIKQEL